jgi:hypothetical protein
MSPHAVPTHSDAMAATARHHELQRWRAAQTVRAHVRDDPDQGALLECLGLLDVTPPVDGRP